MDKDVFGTLPFRLCPTRPDPQPGRPLLFRQHITTDTCHARQARGYHKCHSCEHLELKRTNRAVQAVPISP